MLGYFHRQDDPTPLKNGDTITDTLGRPWTFKVGFMPALANNHPDGEVHVNNGKDKRDKTFKPAFFNLTFVEDRNEGRPPKTETRPERRLSQDVADAAAAVASNPDAPLGDRIRAASEARLLGHPDAVKLITGVREELRDRLNAPKAD